MSKYYVTFEAIVRQTVEIEASSREEAQEKALTRGPREEDWEIAKKSSHLIDIEEDSNDTANTNA